jgi:succinate dehydrogenase / fumarate reductase cytochrome b subunit
MAISHDPRDATYHGRKTDGSPVLRPMSPHLQVYDMLQLQSAMSISHRITGVAWALGMLLFVWWLIAAAAGPAAYGTVQAVFGSFIGVLVLIGMTAAAWYHTLNGVRHLMWDYGSGLNLPMMFRTGHIALAGTAVLTVLTWVIALIVWL